MNLLGKIFVVLILLLSVFLMAFAMVVYATHKNWKDEATKVSNSLSQARAENQQLQSEYQRLDSQLRSEKEAVQQEVRKLESERVILINDNKKFQKDLDLLKQDRRKATAMVASTQENNSGLMKEVTGLREEIRTAQQARDDAFATTLKTTTELHEKQGQLTSAIERMKQLLGQLGSTTALLQRHGHDPHADPDAVPPHVRGVVSAMHRTADNHLIEISIGADDGLRKGHTVEVFRGERYLGRAVIMRTEPDRAVARILRRFQKGQIQEGDHVATKLRIG